ncbi:hypothetical protein QRX50_49345 [Amycolatopsis carbonis]|uniref:Uncharacterized protein n=1 Tax=Amycolatopsis carbonis TaxID=715471 RepID=A0A9Y2MXP1_9PSEU|nr:hypothetical protein [Amycolatopsis sp. 2-15]WIX79239.1 hypothetical protein QRX50_49345 [Amycolatopsis sp. 2-15]
MTIADKLHQLRAVTFQRTKLCAWLSVSTFVGLLAFAVFGWTWLDPVAGFVIAVFAIMEGKEAWEGELVCDDDQVEAAGGKSCSQDCH